MAEYRNFKKPSFCPSCGFVLREGLSFCPNCGRQLARQINPPQAVAERRPEWSGERTASPGNQAETRRKRLHSLPHYEDLEEDSKTKIGIFERIYRQTFQQENGLPLVQPYGYQDIDYAPLVNLLASVLEIELMHSAWNKMKRCYPASFQCGDVTVNLNMPNPTLFDMTLCLEYDRQTKKVLDRFLDGKSQPLAALLTKIRTIRNAASHKTTIGEQRFLVFYEDMSLVFRNYMPLLINLKKNLANASPSAAHEGRRETSCVSTSAQCFRGKSRQGVLFTDTRKLAEKFTANGRFGLETDTCRHLQQALHAYGSCLSQQADICYTLLDVAGLLSTDRHGWEVYRQYLWKETKALRDSQQEPLGLFILGGHDVIPMPQVKNPARQTGELPRPGELVCSEEVLEADLLYAYGENGEADNLLQDGYVDLQWLAHAPAFYTGRLPLADGELSFEDESKFLGYFDRSLQAFCPPMASTVPGIALSGHRHVAVTAEAFCKVSEQMLDRLPLHPLKGDSRWVRAGKLVSPGLDLNRTAIRNGTDGEPSPEGFGDYWTAVQQADVLTFVLHGSGEKYEQGGYYGESRTVNSYQPLAFCPRLLKETSAKVVSGVCCWGARYIGFEPEVSALLTAIYHQTLLFMGACRCAYGTSDRAMEVYQGCGMMYANVLVSSYLRHLMRGVPAGEALERAKFDCLSHTADGSLEITMTTLLEFNLYGDPMLFLQPLQTASGASASESGSDFLNPQCRSIALRRLLSGRLTECKLAWSKNSSVKRSLLETVRSLVDRNLEVVRKTMNEHLYSYYQIEPDTLQSVFCGKNASGKTVYCFSYFPDKGPLTRAVRVYSDERGQVLHMCFMI